jgi:hypothetical protein
MTNDFSSQNLIAAFLKGSFSGEGRESVLARVRVQASQSTTHTQIRWRHTGFYK